MTINEFNNTGWRVNMFAIYHGRTYPIVSCDFEEALVALDGVVLGTEDPSWVRCENIELTNDLKQRKVNCCGWWTYSPRLRVRYLGL